MSHPILIQGRRIYLRTGSRTQTVNVCTAHNQAGRYEVVYRLHTHRITADRLRACVTLDQMETWLRGLGAVDEGPRQLEHHGVPPVQPWPPRHSGDHATMYPLAPRTAAVLAGRRVLVIGHSFVATALVRERVVTLGGEVAAKLTRSVTDVICMPEVLDSDERRSRAIAMNLRVLTMADLALLEQGLLPQPSRHHLPEYVR